MPPERTVKCDTLERDASLEGEKRQRQSSRASLVKEDEVGEWNSAARRGSLIAEEGAPERTLQCDTLGMRSRIVVEEGIGASVALYVSVSGFCNMVDSKKRVKGWRTQEQMKKHNSNRNKRRREMSGEKNKPRGN